MTRSIDVLNTGKGDMKVTFNTEDFSEKIRAKRVVTDMIQRGYALLIKGEDGQYARATSFDESKGEYVIADFDSGSTGEKRRVPMDKAEATAVAPSAGG